MTDMNNTIATQNGYLNHPTHGPFIREGCMAAFPLCFPGMTDPIPLEESRITALTLHPSGLLYGGTSGKGAHVFAACFQGATGVVWDLGRIDDVVECVGIALGRDRLLAAVNNASGGELLYHDLEKIPDFDLLQEWSFLRTDYKPLAWPLSHERILDFLSLPNTSQAVGITEKHLFIVDVDSGQCEVVAEIHTTPRLIVSDDGHVFGLDDKATLWQYDPARKELARRAVSLPAGTWGESPLICSRDARSDTIYLADSEGVIHAFAPNTRTLQRITEAPLAPVRCLITIPDGRVYGFCGREIEHLFVFDPADGGVSDLGVVVSVIERRRYGYEFSTAVVNQNGHIIFGENDNLGHLWLYFPRIKAK